MRNETAAALTLTQGSGANVVIAAGQTKIVATDGAGSGAVVYEMDDLELAGDLSVGDDLTFTSDSAVITFGADGDTTLTHTDGAGLTLNSTNKIMFNDATQFIHAPSGTVLDIGATDEIELTATLIDVVGNLAVSGDIDLEGAIDVNGTTNLDIVDIDGAVNMATTALVTGVLTTTAATVFNGGFASNAASTITVADNSDTLSLISTDADASAGPILNIYRNSASPADNDLIGSIKYVARNDNSQDVITFQVDNYITDVSDGTEDAASFFYLMEGGGLRERLGFGSTATVFNEDGLDVDFRVESNDNANMLFIDGGSNHVGIGTATPDTNNFGSGHGVLGVASATGSAKTAMLNLIGDGNDTADTRVSSVFFNDASATGAGATLAGIEAYRATNHATDPGGNLLFSTNASGGSYTTHAIIRAGGTVGFSADGNFSDSKSYTFRDGVGIDNPNASSFSTSTAAVICAGAMSSGRSINATGTINASGADYAEYMYKADGCGTIAKGDVVGVDINGKLTDVFADAISFVIKSTNPSYVGGDTWADEEPPTKDEKDTTEWDSWYERTETKRATVDRIAFSGQVPVNITGSFNAGDYVYPEVNGSGIKAVAKSSPTFDEYKLCVGKIWATEKDGRPFVAVKIG